MSPTPRLRRLLIAGWGLSLGLLLLLGAILVRNLLGGEAGGVFGVLAGTPPEQPTERPITLYFAVPGAEGLRGEARLLPILATAPDDIRASVEALIGGPRRDLTPTVDARVRLLNVYVLDRTVVLDFSAEIQTTHTGGSINELLTIYSLVNTITHNFNAVDAVKLLVEGEEIETLNGHVDTRFPFRANPDWILPEYTS